MQKMCDCVILKKKKNNGRQRPYSYFIQLGNESGWVNSSVGYNIGDSASVYLTPHWRNDQWFPVIK